MGTQIKLIEDLKQKPESELRESIIKFARSGGYHDFKAAVATPKLLLVEHLIKAGYIDLSEKARRGHYDDKFEKPTLITSLTPRASQKKKMTAEEKADSLPPSDPVLLTAMDEIRAISKKYDVGLLVNLHSKTHAEYGMEFPTWSRARFIERPDGKTALHIKMKSGDGRHEDNEATIGMIVGMRDVCVHQATEMEKLQRQLAKHVDFDHVGKFNHHSSAEVTTDEQPDPSRAS